MPQPRTSDLGVVEPECLQFGVAFGTRRVTETPQYFVCGEILETERDDIAFVVGSVAPVTDTVHVDLVVIQDAQTGPAIRTLNGHTRLATSVSFSPSA